jgi:hypothetical protein
MQSASSTLIDITGIDRVELLHHLWKGQILAGFYDKAPQFVPGFDHDAALRAIAHGPIDYFCGRAIKTDLSKDVVCSRLYDRDAGAGTFAKIVAQMKNQK